MMRTIEPKEELYRRTERFTRIQRGYLFKIMGDRYFIAAARLHGKAWKVIELTDENREKIALGEKCETSVLDFHDMRGLYLEAPIKWTPPPIVA